MKILYSMNSKQDHTPKKTEHSIGGVSFWITWSADGKRGIDQRGQEWFDINDPHTENGIVEVICKASAVGIQLASRKFMRI
jgi:hypothetical protein